VMVVFTRSDIPAPSIRMDVRPLYTLSPCLSSPGRSRFVAYLPAIPVFVAVAVLILLVAVVVLNASLGGALTGPDEQRIGSGQRGVGFSIGPFWLDAGLLSHPAGPPAADHH
jgi:hypothetical protein